MNTLSLWTRRDPFAGFDDTFNALVRRAFGPAAYGADRRAGFVPAADLSRDGDTAVLRLELPGLDVDKDVTVEVDRGRLVVKGERRSERGRDEDGTAVREVHYGSFERSFTLPEHVGADAVNASYDAGVLTVRVTGAYASPEPTAHRVAITAGPASAPAVEPIEAADSGEHPAA
ncbi:MAG TPA: Hsp20/alpha crystallin family protein [Mycobacteriales bacterium]|jgi:HSP20 family molecular chaperone IbpA|nr:Hsp20/alpha crystallin family protein [Mycobacteriales bacterium]